MILHLRTSPLVRAPTQLALYPSHTTCMVDYLQLLRFGNSQSPKKFTENPKTQINVYTYIAHHLRGQWHSPISPQTAKTPFLGSYSCHVTFQTHKAFLSENEPPLEYFVMTPLYLSLPNPSFNELIQDFVTKSSILSNIYIQLGFPSSDSLGNFTKLLKEFSTSDMDYRK